MYSLQHSQNLHFLVPIEMYGESDPSCCVLVLHSPDVAYKKILMLIDLF